MEFSFLCKITDFVTLMPLMKAPSMNGVVDASFLRASKYVNFSVRRFSAHLSLGQANFCQSKFILTDSNSLRFFGSLYMHHSLSRKNISYDNGHSNVTFSHSFVGRNFLTMSFYFAHNSVARSTNSRKKVRKIDCPFWQCMISRKITICFPCTMWKSFDFSFNQISRKIDFGK